MKVKVFLSNNFGDEPLNSYLYTKIVGKSPTIISIHEKSPQYNYLICGSILSSADKNSIVWGSGFITQNAQLPNPPHKIYAVRGKLTWNQLKNQKITTPYIFGDPALILPKIYNPVIQKKYQLGIIPHYTEQNSELLNQYRIKNIKIIDICQKVENVINDILSCENIVSSSLHGLIVADAYKIPSLWIGIGDKIQGVGFKYFDYYSITDRNPIIKYQLEKKLDYNKLLKYCYLTNFTVDLDKFWEVCPLRRENESVDEL